MTPEAKLQRIRAKCVELLEIAEKRTPPEFVMPTGYVGLNNKGEHYRAGWHHGAAKYADYIVSCAGSAEAGWRATIAAIDNLLDDGMADAIIAAWEGQI